MEITKTIVAFGNRDMIAMLVTFVLLLICFFISLKHGKSAFTPFMLFLFGISSLVAFIVFAFVPEQVLYKAQITNYEEVQEQGYLIKEHITDDIYYIEKK